MWWRLKAISKQTVKLYQHIDQPNTLRLLSTDYIGINLERSLICLYCSSDISSLHNFRGFLFVCFFHQQISLWWNFINQNPFKNWSLYHFPCFHEVMRREYRRKLYLWHMKVPFQIQCVTWNDHGKMYINRRQRKKKQLKIVQFSSLQVCKIHKTFRWIFLSGSVDFRQWHSVNTCNFF